MGYFKESAALNARTLETWLNKAIQDIRALGAFKTVGFGQIADIKVKFDEIKPDSDRQTSTQLSTTNLSTTLSEQALTVAFSADRPLCFAQPRSKTNNTFTTSDDIPGNAIKACIANSTDFRQLVSDHPLKIYFDELVVKHALPVPSVNNGKGLTRPQSPPLSLQCFNVGKKDIFINAATCATPHALKSSADIVAGAFPTDYKSAPDTATSTAFNVNGYAPKRHLSVHTAVDANTLSAQNSQLHAIEVVDNTDTQWVTAFSLPPTTAATHAEQRQLSLTLQTLLRKGLLQAGKTKAKLTAMHFDNIALPSLDQHGLQPDGLFVIKLESDAQLFTHEQLQQHASTPRTALQTLLTHYFDQHFTVDGQRQAQLHAFHADTKVVGGDYLYHRFRTPEDHAYHSHMLVTAGSTFAFKVLAQDVTALKQQLAAYCHSGLPVACNTLSWRSTPYMPQNGFARSVS
ncbi:chaperonin GroEL HSP60 family [Photobacterium aphoticum]|uniref:Chaperonin GroEL HSP60 family n=1 Tax=Photobacterium aphoticum TaxID=754436 RepID=A0A090QVD0_9GAMM|nr:chaperonin GroEL HSP60 family [Photobacterium aphoticum]